MADPYKPQTGLEWIRTTFSAEPRWTLEPELDSIKMEVEKSLSAKGSEVSFLSQGAFNKLYTVQAGSETSIMRVTLPIDPFWKTTSEVATTIWMHHNTQLPVPKILAYAASRANPIGFEWILMTKLPGDTLSSAWQSIGLEAKYAIVQRLAECEAALYDKQAEEIGNFYLRDDSDLAMESVSSEVGKVVSLEFLWGDRQRHGVTRGPFRSSREWLSARLTLLAEECKSVLNDPDSDEDDLDDAERTSNIIEKLQDCLSTLFPADETLPERTMLHHDDLSLHNVLVDSQGILTGVVDWECVSLLPVWKSCDYPTFLQERPRRLEPAKDKYTRDEDEEPNSLYWMHLMEYERTLLRQEFLNAMQRLQPHWIEVFESSVMQRSFEYAVTYCDNEFLAQDIEEWIETVGKGPDASYDLRDRIQAE